MVATMQARDVIRTFLDAVEARDTVAAAQCFAPDAPYQNVPHPPVVGPPGVEKMLRTILAASSAVHWEVLTEAYVPGRGHLERVDRFVIDGVEHAAPCHGVFEVDETAGLITSFRDYVDLGPWRADLAAALERWAADHGDEGSGEPGANTIG